MGNQTTIADNTAIKKKAFLDVYRKAFGNITVTCDTININRTTYYDWVRKDEVFAQQVNDCDPLEIKLDFIENKLMERIDKGDTTAIIFALKTIGRKRGYQEIKLLGEDKDNKFTSFSDGVKAINKSAGGKGSNRKDTKKPDTVL